MKVSVIIATWNKHEYLPNTLYSLIKQKTSFPLEICIVDDCSDIDPEPIIRQFIPEVKYMRLEEHIGFMFSYGKCLELVDKESDVILIQSDDIIHTRSDSIELICKDVKSRTISLSEVVDIPMENNIINDFDNIVNNITSNWESYIKTEFIPIDGLKYRINSKYSGKGHRSNLFFCGAISRTDLDYLRFSDISCDAIIGLKISEAEFDRIYPPVKAIHQRHPKSVYPCPIVNECKYRCIRKEGHLERIGIKK